MSGMFTVELRGFESATSKHRSLLLYLFNISRNPFSKYNRKLHKNAQQTSLISGVSVLKRTLSRVHKGPHAKLCPLPNNLTCQVQVRIVLVRKQHHDEVTRDHRSNSARSLVPVTTFVVEIGDQKVVHGSSKNAWK